MIEEGCNVKGIKIPEEITIIMAPNTREGLAISASNFYGNPSAQLKLIGVTGTKGKTTTTYMIKEILEKAGKKVGYGSGDMAGNVVYSFLSSFIMIYLGLSVNSKFRHPQ